MRNDKAVPEDTDLLFRWGCTSNVPVLGVSIVNTAAAIHLVSDKVTFRKKLDESGLCPPTFVSGERIPDDTLAAGMVVRPRHHSRGRNLFFVHDRLELSQAVAKCGEGWYASPYIKKIAEYRVFVVQGRAVAVANKIPNDAMAIAWNVAQGGAFENVRWKDWPLKAVRIAIEGFNLSGLDFGGVDVMIDGEGAVYILEINSAPSLTSDYRQTCMAKAFDWIVEHGKVKIPLSKELGGYRKFIHPAVCERAEV